MSPKEKLFFQLVSEGFYSIDAEGNIWIEKPRTVVKNFTRRIKKLVVSKGYLRLTINHTGKRICIGHHRIVYIHQHGDIPNGMWINHIDGNRQNNDISNLETVTPRENALHAFNVTKSNRSYGENSPRARLSRKDVVRIYWLHWREKLSYKEIAGTYGISKHHAYEVCKLRSWRYLWRVDGKVTKD